jgi:3-dehydrotetronate 4-kinase
MRKPVLGCIADDFTGATDLANNLVRGGMRVVQTIGVPDTALDEEADAIVVALKSRTIAPADAVAQSLQALGWLREQGIVQVYFKYCSTFDSTPAGNIGPVTDALMRAMGCDFTIACPALPDNGRTVFKGYLFVGDELLHESGMRNHPLTPMTDSNLVRALQAQTTRQVGLIDYRSVARGAQAVRQHIAKLRSQGVEIAVVDATSNAELVAIGPAWADLPLVTAGSGIAIGLPGNFDMRKGSAAAQLPAARGLRAVLSGSCSVATNGQVRSFLEAGGAGFAIDPLQLANGVDLVTEALDWSRPRLARGTVLIYARAEPAAVTAAQRELGVDVAGALVESALAAIARGLAVEGVGQLVVAGGETSGACVQALGITRLRIGPQIAPGVPWCHARSPFAPQGLHLVLKSGNFGGQALFHEAFECLA